MSVELRNFLSSVLPTQGEYVVWYINQSLPNGRNVPFATVFEMAEWLTDHKDQQTNNYIAVGAFKERKGRRSIQRTKQNARAFKSLILDIDVGVNDGGKTKPYVNQRSAVEAVLTFCTNASISFPWIISSGWGIHCWWPLTHEISPQQWYSLQNILCNLCAAYGLEVDRGGSNRISQVLRPPFSINWRKNTQQSKTTRIVHAATELVDTNGLISWLTETAKTINYEPHYYDNKLEQFKKPVDDLSHYNNYVPADWRTVEKRCAQVEYALSNQAVITYDHWWSLIGVAKFTNYPEAAAKRWSELHPRYTEGETLFKLQEWKSGPTLCKTFEDYGPKDAVGESLCINCSYYNHAMVKSPVQIGTQREEFKLDKPIILPDSYRFTTEGLAVVEDDIEQVISPYIIWLDSIYYDNAIGKECVIIKWRELAKSNERTITVESAQVNTTATISALGEVFGNQGITFSNGSVEARAMLQYFADFKRQLETQDERPEIQNSNGWHGKNIMYFTYGNHIISVNDDGWVDAKEIDHNIVTSIAKGIEQQGDAKKWTELTSIYDEPGLQGQGFALLAGIGSPLVQFTNLGGMILHLHGPTGTGKTSTLKIVNSVFGNPEELLLRGKSTHNAIISRLAVNKNFAATIDEITNMESRQASDFIYESSSGQEKGRLSADLKERKIRTWNAPIITSGNKNLESLLVGDRLNRNPELVRTLELQIGRTPWFSSVELTRQWISVLDNNYGHAAIPMLQIYVFLHKQKGADLRLWLADVFERRYTGFKFQGHERYQQALIETALTGGRIAAKKGLIDFKIDPCIEWALDSVESQRVSVQDLELEPLSLLGSFLNENITNTLILQIKDGVRIVRLEPKHKLQVRIEVDIKKDKILSANCYIARTSIARWLSFRGESFAGVRNTLAAEGVCSIDDVKYSLGKDTMFAAARINALKVDLQHESLSHLLSFFSSNTPNLEVVPNVRQPAG